MHSFAVLCSVFVGVVFVFASATKFIAFENWLRDSSGLGINTQIARLVPFVEGVVGIGSMLVVATQLFAAAALVMLIAMTALLVSKLSAGSPPTCACFGKWSRRQISRGDVFRNFVLMALTVIAIVAG